MYKIIYTKKARKDWKKIKASNLDDNVEKLLKLLKNNPYEPRDNFEQLKKDFDKSYSRRINRQHRLIYQVYKKERIVKIIRMWTHYE